MVAESPAREIKPCVSFRGAKLSRMVADPQKPQKFNPTKVKAYTVLRSLPHFYECSPSYSSVHRVNMRLEYFTTVMLCIYCYNLFQSIVHTGYQSQIMVLYINISSIAV